MSKVEFPTELDVLLIREFHAPIQLVFDVLTKPEHIRRHLATFGETVTVCDVDLRAGGEYHYVMVTRDGEECSFRGTFLEVEPPHRTTQTWHFEGWPGVEAVETTELREGGGVTTLTNRLAFRDQAGRDHMTKYDGIETSFDNVEKVVMELLLGPE